MNKKQEQQILNYYSTTGKYICSKTRSNVYQRVFTKESNKYKWLVLEQKNHCEVEVRQTENYGTNTSRDSYELMKNISKCVEQLCECANIQIHFNDLTVSFLLTFM